MLPERRHKHRTSTGVILVRILYIDIDTLRPDHLSCYGYERNTSPNIDRIAGEGVRFENCCVSDAPCLPSRAALWNGRFGIHTGIVNHGGTAADLRIEGQPRGFRTSPRYAPWMACLRNGGMYTVSVSPYAERHSAWWFCAGFREFYNPGKGGNEIADDVSPYAVEWLEKNAERDDWFLHVNFWDPHTMYRTPMAYGNPFESDPAPGWPTAAEITAHFNSYGPHSAQDLGGWAPCDPERHPRVPAQIATPEDYRKWIDGYDVGIRYADDHVGKILGALAKAGVLDETVIIVSSDHAENQGELNVYGDHQTADYSTPRVPLIIRWPGLPRGRVDTALHYQADMAATVLELLGIEMPPTWDAESFAPSLRAGAENGREYLVLSQCAWSCQRSVRRGPWLMIRTYHDGLKDFPEHMLFNVEDDRHETTNLAEARPDIVVEHLALLDQWHGEMMGRSESEVDPLWNVIREGGPLHTRGSLESYCERLRATGRGHHAQALEARHGGRTAVVSG